MKTQPLLLPVYVSVIVDYEAHALFPLVGVISLDLGDDTGLSTDEAPGPIAGLTPLAGTCVKVRER